MQLRRIVGAPLALAIAMGIGVSARPGFAAGSQASGTAPAQVPAAPTRNLESKTPPQKLITPAQAKELFADVGQILRFASKDTKLPIKHQVKSRLISRAQVKKYLLSKMSDDKDAKRMEREEIVLKKFGLLDPDFRLRPFLVQLLDEQIAAFYNAKTRTVNLLNWIPPDQQKPVLAHELTHALQDQHVPLAKWEDATSDKISHTYREDVQHVDTDEDSTAREAVVEGQAMAVFVDYSLAPMGRNLRNSPELVNMLINQMSDNGSGQDPVLSRAPLLLQESLLFPYKYGLKFEADLMADDISDPAAPFAGVLDRPPTSSYEIMNPQAYQRHVKVPVLKMPDIHPLIDTDYNPYDIGVMGSLDVHILSELFGGPQAAAEFTPAWDGGIYYAAQRKNDPDKTSLGSVALFYLSQWTTVHVASDFASMYASELGQQFSQVAREKKEETGPDERVYQTSQGPVLIAKRGRDVFVSESFPLDMARKLEFYMTSAQQQGGTQRADLVGPGAGNWQPEWMPARPEFSREQPLPQSDLTADMVRFMASCGLMKAAMIR